LGRFSGTIDAHKTNAIPRLHFPVDILEDFTRGVNFTDMFESQHYRVSKADEGKMKTYYELRIADGLISELIVTKFNRKFGLANFLISGWKPLEVIWLFVWKYQSEDCCC
jgi:hypothetical protein